MHRTTGNFYFKLTTAGHLIGEYSNHANPWARPECAFREDDIPDCERRSFEGRYVSTWYEPDSRSAEVLILTIEARNDSLLLFNLSWSDRNGRPHYSGQAMLNDGQLIGNYWSVDS